MSKDNKFSEEEMNTIKEMQTSYFENQNKFGQLSVAKIRLDQQMTDLEKEEGNLKKEFHELQQKEKNFLKYNKIYFVGFSLINLIA